MPEELPIDTPTAPAGAPKFAKNREELAELLGGYDVKSISRWLKIEGNPGRTTDNRYEVEAWRAWIDRTGRRHAPKDKATKVDFETRLAAIKNERAEIELAEYRGRMIDVDEVNQVIDTLFTEVVQRLRTVAHELSPALAGQSPSEVRTRLGAAHDRVLEAMSIPGEAKKKVFWRSVHARLSDLQRKYLPSTGPRTT